MDKMTSEQALAYLARWQHVQDTEVAELRRTSIETKFTQLAALMASRDVFGPEPDRETQVREVRERWARLRQALGG
jgi:hypothetical protein